MCDNGEVFSFEAEKFPFKNLRENLSKSISLLPLLLCSLCFERVVLFQLLFLLRLKNARRSVENQTRIPHHSKQSKSIQNQLCVRVDIHTFLQIVLYSIAHQKDEHRKHVVFFFREDVCHFPPKPSRGFFVFVVFAGEIVRENEITSEPPTWQPKTTRE